MRAVMVAVVLLLLAGCGGAAGSAAPDKPATEAVTIKFRLADYDTAFADCQGQGGYSDITEGTPVTIKDGDGRTLGAASLGMGEASSNGVQAAYCDWTVEVPGVAADADFYAVEVGSRGEITTSRSDLAENDWTMQVTLGSL